MSPDGRNLLYFEYRTATNADLFILPLDGGKPFPFAATPGVDRCGRFSQDGQSIAYFSDVSGLNEVYVKPLLPDRRAVQVSMAGGTAPQWSTDGRTLYFGHRDQRTLLAASRTGNSFAEPRTVFTYDNMVSAYDVLPGGRFVVLERDAVAASPPIHVIVRWPDSAARP